MGGEALRRRAPRQRKDLGAPRKEYEWSTNIHLSRNGSVCVGTVRPAAELSKADLDRAEIIDSDQGNATTRLDSNHRL